MRAKYKCCYFKQCFQNLIAFDVIEIILCIMSECKSHLLFSLSLSIVKKAVWQNAHYGEHCIYARTHTHVHKDTASSRCHGYDAMIAATHTQWPHALKIDRRYNYCTSPAEALTNTHTPGPGSSFTAAQMAPTAPFTPSTTNASICHPTSLENSEDEEDVCFCACEVNIPDLSEWFPVLSLSFRFSITVFISPEVPNSPFN